MPILTPRPMRVDMVRPGGAAGEGFAREVEAVMGSGSSEFWADEGSGVGRMVDDVKRAVAEVAELVVFIAIVVESWKLLTGMIIVVVTLDDSDVVMVALVEGDELDYDRVSLCRFSVYRSADVLGLQQTNSKPSMPLRD